jgi:hypothetical protein
MFSKHYALYQYLPVIGWLSFDSSEFISGIAAKVIKIHLVFFRAQIGRLKNTQLVSASNHPFPLVPTRSYAFYEKAKGYARI